MRRLWRDYSLSITLAGLFLVSLALQLWSQWKLGEGGWEMLAAVMENHQSEYLQLLTFVVLTAYLSHKGSPESKSADEETRAALARIERKLEP